MFTTTTYGKERKMYAIYAKLRDEKGIRDIDVARATDIPPSTFTEWKKGTYQPKVDKLLKIANFLGVSVETFIKVTA